MDDCILKGEKQMEEKSKITDFNLFVDEEIAQLFRKVAVDNGTTAKEVLLGFMKDYIVSGGHPEQVVNRWPWNKKE